jgi:uncharacterized phage protein (TIGR01671 family)
MNKRTLKFRVWDIKNKNFLSQSSTYYHIGDVTGIPYTLNEILNKPDRFIVQQFTGFIDSKGNEVWEGDVVRIIYEGKIAEVYFDYNLGSFRLKDTNGKSYPITTYRFDESGNPIGLINVFDEVIGTVFDNE